MTVQLDDLDRHLLVALREDARLPVATLAARLGVTRATVANRMARLEREGVIVGYTIRLGTRAAERAVRAIMLVAVEGNRGEDVRRQLAAHPAVTGLHTTNGRWDLVAELEADSLEAFDRALAEIRLAKGISTTETNILLTSYRV